MAQQLSDPYAFLGIDSGAPPAGAIEDVPNYQDPYAFLGTGRPGEVMPATQSVSPAAPGAFDWDWTRQIGSGLGFGFGPQLQGTEDYLRAGGPFSSSPLTLGDRITNAEANQEAFERTHPGAKTTELLSSIPSVMAVNALTPGLSQMARAPSVFSRMGAGAIAGMEAGALQTPITGGDVVENALMGGAIQGALPGASGAVGNLLSPRVAPGVVDTVRDLEGLGVKLRPTQVAKSQGTRRVDEFFAHGGNEQQLKDFTRAVSKTFGENTEELTPKVMGAAWDRITNSMDQMAAQTTVTLDQPLAQGMALISANLRGLPKAAQAQVREAIADVNRAFTNGQMHGTTYQRLTAKGGILMNLSRDAHPTVREAGGKLRELLDDAVERSSPQGTREGWIDARQQFKNLIAVQPLVEGNTSGLLNPQALHGQVKKVFDEYGWGALPGGMNTLAEGGRLLPKTELTGGARAGEALPWYWRVAPGVGVGLGGYAAVTYDPKALAIMAAGMVAAGATKKAVGTALKSNTARNALTGGVSPPSLLGDASRTGLTGAVNSLNAQFGDDSDAQ